MEELMVELAGSILVGLFIVAGLMHCCWFGLYDYNMPWESLQLGIEKAYWNLHLCTTKAMPRLSVGFLCPRRLRL